VGGAENEKHKATSNLGSGKRHTLGELSNVGIARKVGAFKQKQKKKHRSG